MLNELLYNALAAFTGTAPVIRRRAEEARIELPVKMVSTMYPDHDDTVIPRITGGEEYSINCPYCGDTRGRLDISYLWDTQFKVGDILCTGSERLVRCYNEECMRNPLYRKEFLLKLREIRKNPPVLELRTDVASTDTQGSIANQVQFPPLFESFEDGAKPPDNIQRYVESRGLSLELLARFGVGWVPYYGKFKNPLIVAPVFQNNEYWFWQGRLVPESGNPLDPILEVGEKGTPYPKYYIPQGAKKSWSIYNLDNVVNGSTIILTEGIFDVWALEESAVALFGKTMSSYQFRLLTTKCKGADILYLPDADDPQAWGIAMTTCRNLKQIGSFNSVGLLRLPDGEDPASIRERLKTKEATWSYLTGLDCLQV